MYMEKHNGKSYYCAGDIDQRMPLNFGCNNVDDQNTYQLFCLNRLFPSRITLLLING